MSGVNKVEGPGFKFFFLGEGRLGGIFWRPSAHFGAPRNLGPARPCLLPCNKLYVLNMIKGTAAKYKADSTVTLLLKMFVTLAGFSAKIRPNCRDFDEKNIIIKNGKF